MRYVLGKNKGANFGRAVSAYYKYCYRNGTIPIKPLKPYSEIASRHVFLRNQFGLIAKIFFLKKNHRSMLKKPDYALSSFVLEPR